MIRNIIFLLCCFIAQSVLGVEKIVVLGDSISAGFGIKQNRSWVSLLQQRLEEKEYAYQTINASISGDTTSGGLNRIDNILSNHSPAIIIVELGGNDGLRGLKLKTIKQNLLKIVEKCEQNKSKVLLVGMQLPPNYGFVYTSQFSKIFQSIAQEKNIPTVPFIFKGFENNMKYFQDDGIHPTEEAQIFLLDNIWPTLQKIL